MLKHNSFQQGTALGLRNLSQRAAYGSGMHIENGMSFVFFSAVPHRCDVRLLLAITEPTRFCNSKKRTSHDGLSQRIDHMTGEEDLGS